VVKLAITHACLKFLRTLNPKATYRVGCGPQQAWP